MNRWDLNGNVNVNVEFFLNMEMFLMNILKVLSLNAIIATEIGILINGNEAKNINYFK